MMGPKLFAFDLDGTLVEDHLEDNGTGQLVPRTDLHYTEPRERPGVLLGLARLPAYACIAICTNQGGVALGFQTPEEVATRLSRALMLLNFFDGRAFSVHYCMEHHTVPGGHAAEWRRKPNPGMLQEAMLAHNAAPSETLYVGDRQTDAMAAQRAGCAYGHPDTFFGGPQ